MDILVLFGTSEGQTRKVAQFAAACLRKRGHDVVLKDVEANLPLLDLSDCEAALLASRVHAGHHHHAIVAFARRHQQLLKAMDTAFLSVSMSAARLGSSDAALLEQYRAGFAKATGWQPDHYHDVAGARLYTQHNRLTRWILGLVDRQKFDTARDHEFTDWADLGSFMEGWAQALASNPPRDLPFRRQGARHRQ